MSVDLIYCSKQLSKSNKPAVIKSCIVYGFLKRWVIFLAKRVLPKVICYILVQWALWESNPWPLKPTVGRHTNESLGSPSIQFLNIQLNIFLDLLAGVHHSRDWKHRDTVCRSILQRERTSLNNYWKLHILLLLKHTVKCMISQHIHRPKKGFGSLLWHLDLI